MKRKLGKRGSLQDIVMIAVTLFAIALIGLIAFKVSDSINTEIQSSADIPTEGKTAMNTITNYYPGVIDNSYMLLVFVLAISTLITASLVRIHPVFIIFFIIGLLTIIFVCGALSQTYSEIASHPELSSLANNLTFITYTMRFLPIIIGVIGTLLAIIMFKANRSEGLG